jgi:hypothetical protein
MRQVLGKARPSFPFLHGIVQREEGRFVVFPLAHSCLENILHYSIIKHQKYLLGFIENLI